MAPTHVLVPLDGSPLAEEALVFALETFDCQVTVLNVVTPLDAGMSESGIVETDEPRLADARKRADRLVEGARERAATGEQAVETAVETGDPAETIVEFVRTTDVDHVAMGSHGGPRAEIARRLLGTVATRVVSEAPATVTVLR